MEAIEHAEGRVPESRIYRPHDAAVAELLKADPDFATEYLAAALDEADQPGGQMALLAALRHVVEAQGMAAVAERAGMPRETLYRALSPKGNPTIKSGTYCGLQHDGNAIPKRT